MENIVKGWFTTLLGLALMTLGSFEFYEEADWYRCGVPFIAGFILLFMRDKISEWITSLVMAAIEKFKK